MGGMVEPPPRDPSADETVISDGWPESDVVVEQRDEVVEPPRRRPPTLWPWLLALLVLVLAGLGALYALTRDDDEQTTTTAATTLAEERTVPDVVGTTSSEATETLREAGFEADLVSVPSARPPGTVVAQDPAPGTTRPKGTSVRLNVAEAAQTTTGKTTTGATTTSPATTTTPATTTAPATTPPPPQPRPATVPDVVGQELADGARAFADSGLKVSVAFVPAQEPFGRVVAQAQPAGTERERGDTVQLNVSAGPDPAERTAVPRATGQRLDDGRETLEGAGFAVLALTVGDGEIRNESTIASQSPAAGASVPRGALVLVYV